MKVYEKSEKWARKGLGWRPDLPDHRDYPLSLTSILKPEVKIPVKVDLRDTQCLSPVEDQGELGSCTANAIIGAMEYILNKQKEEFVDLSRLFVYYNERLIEGSIDEDAGAYIRDGIKSLYRKGVCKESSWPYDISKFAELPPDTCYTEAKEHKIVLYQRIKGIRQMKACLATEYPFIFGFTVYDSFMSDAVAQSGVVPMPTKEETVQGGHAVLCVGYDDSKKRFICKNSWGTGWGESGYFTMPYKYLTDRNLSDDFWVVRL
jgi:C1A family cysteine protease